MERPEDQPAAYRHDMLPPNVPTVAVEARTSRGWHHLISDIGIVIGLDRSGVSGPGEEVCEGSGFTVDRVVEAVHYVLENTPAPATPAS